MRRAALVTAILLTACYEHGSTPDGFDAGPGGSGSSAAMDGMDPSPPDVALEWIVVGLSTIVVIGPIRSRRRHTKSHEI